MVEDPILRMDNIVKEFPRVVANDNVNLSVNKGEIHGLLGENGAGKSTLMKILYGLYSQDEGDIYLNGDRLSLDSPQDAIDAGIGMVHQHFMLIPRLTVAENVVLGEREPTTLFRPDEETRPVLPLAIRERLPEAVQGGVPESIRTSRPIQAFARRFSLGLNVPKQRIQDLAEQYGFDVDVGVKLWELDVGQQQRVEILKALYRDVDLLILDEPTAVLTPMETERMFDSLEQLTDEGLSVIFITHKLNEVDTVVDRVTVLRDGENVGTTDVADVSQAELAEMMVGREVLFQVQAKETDPDESVLKATGVTVFDARGIEKLSGIDLSVRRGEIVGIVGVSGNGQKELAEVLAGIRDVSAGEVVVDGTDLTNVDPQEFVDAGVSFVPEDRYKYGCAADLSVMHNAVIKDYRNGSLGEGLFLNYGELSEYAETLVDEFDVRGVTNVSSMNTGDLSGGNLQKLILAREIYRDPDLLVVNQPTRGVDVGAIELIRDGILKQCREGTGVVLISEDIDEIINLSDRILVIYEGEFVHETTPAEAVPERLGLEMTGGTEESAETPSVESGTGRESGGGSR